MTALHFLTILARLSMCGTLFFFLCFVLLLLFFLLVFLSLLLVLLLLLFVELLVTASTSDRLLYKKGVRQPVDTIAKGPPYAYLA